VAQGVIAGSDRFDPDLAEFVGAFVNHGFERVDIMPLHVLEDVVVVPDDEVVALVASQQAELAVLPQSKSSVGEARGGHETA